MIKPIRGSRIDTGHPLARGLVAAYLFNEGTGDLLWDYAGGHRGTLVGGPTWCVGEMGAELGFDGGSDYVTLGQAGLPIGSRDAFTAVTWFRVESGKTGTLTACGKNSSAGRHHHSFAWIGGIVQGYVGGVAFAGTVVVDDGDWHCHALVSDGTAFASYIDGVLDASGSTGAGAPSGIDMLIGARRDGDNTDIATLFEGDIASVLIYSRALSAAEVRSLYERPYQMFRWPRRRTR